MFYTSLLALCLLPFGLFWANSQDKKSIQNVSKQTILANDTLKRLLSVRNLPTKTLSEKFFLLSGESNAFEKVHGLSDKNNGNSEMLNQMLENLVFLPEIKSYKEFETSYTVFSMGKWETKTHYLVLYGIYTPIVHGLADYHLASFSKTGKFVNQVSLFGYSLTDGKIDLTFDGKNSVSVKVVLDKSPDEPNNADDTDFKIVVQKNGFLKSSKIVNK